MLHDDRRMHMWVSRRVGRALLAALEHPYVAAVTDVVEGSFKNYFERFAR